MSKRGDLLDQVECVLRDYPKTRNCDIELTKRIWIIYYRDYLLQHPQTKKFWIDIDAMNELPREDHIKRLRAIIQNEQHKYPPTTWKVAKARHYEEKLWLQLIAQATEYKRI